jgi:hypothetical protein
VAVLCETSLAMAPFHTFFGMLSEFVLVSVFAVKVHPGSLTDAKQPPACANMLP